MQYLINKLTLFSIIALIFLSVMGIQKWIYETSSTKGATKGMKTYYIGRFSIAVPALMTQKMRSSKLGYVDLNEVVWPKSSKSDEAREAEWARFLAKAHEIRPPDGANDVVIILDKFPAANKWIRGMFYYDGNYSTRVAIWTAQLDAGPVGLWLIGDPSMVEEEKSDPKMRPNLEKIAEAYQPFDVRSLTMKSKADCFYLQHGVINLPYSEQEEAIARFEGHPLNLTLLIEMEMDFTKERETMSLIKATRGFLAAALLSPGGGASKVRLRKREVAGMPGEEAVLKIREGQHEDLVFTWQYNGKDDSGEYPATKIEMQSPAGHLSEKLEIWDAILDSMQPMFERKKS